MFTGASINALLYDELPKDLHPLRLGGSYTGTFADVLPHLMDAFSRVLDRVRSAVPSTLAMTEDIVVMTSELSNPDPLVRGHPVSRAIHGATKHAYSLERYLNRLDVLATKAAIHERRAVRP